MSKYLVLFHTLTVYYRAGLIWVRRPCKSPPEMTLRCWNVYTCYEFSTSSFIKKPPAKCKKVLIYLFCSSVCDDQDQQCINITGSPLVLWWACDRCSWWFCFCELILYPEMEVKKKADRETYAEAGQFNPSSVFEAPAAVCNVHQWKEGWVENYWGEQPRLNAAGVRCSIVSFYSTF